MEGLLVIRSKRRSRVNTRRADVRLRHGAGSLLPATDGVDEGDAPSSPPTSVCDAQARTIDAIADAIWTGTKTHVQDLSSNQSAPANFCESLAFYGFPLSLEEHLEGQTHQHQGKGFAHIFLREMLGQDRTDITAEGNADS